MMRTSLSSESVPRVELDQRSRTAPASGSSASIGCSFRLLQ
jgi:hypothetical protein